MRIEMRVALRMVPRACARCTPLAVGMRLDATAPALL
jgi:hypothetical protein